MTGMTLARCAFGQDALQGAAMHVQPSRGFGDVAVAHFIDALDVFLERTWSADIGLCGSSDFSVPLASNAATTSSASAGFER